ncbi:MAG: PEP-CTERM sorting domain-containing protein [bacterium]
MRLAPILTIALICAPAAGWAQSDTTVLFIGNSFTYGHGSPVRFYRPDTVTDLNSAGIGGVPALFESFTAQVGLDYDVHVETQPGSGLDFHLENRLGTIGRKAWDAVVMHGQSTLDFAAPGDPGKLVDTSGRLAEFLKVGSPAVEVHLMSTWSRADQTYQPEGAWFGKPIDAMARDVRTGYDQAAKASDAITSVIPVGEAWARAMETGVADSNPYDGTAFGTIDLWTFDHYHASTYGYYLEALVVFGRLTGRDPRSLGDHECSAFELGLSRQQTSALQQVAFDTLASEGGLTPAPFVLDKPASLARCVDRR